MFFFLYIRKCFLLIFSPGDPVASVEKMAENFEKLAYCTMLAVLHNYLYFTQKAMTIGVIVFRNTS